MSAGLIHDKSFWWECLKEFVNDVPSYTVFQWVEQNGAENWPLYSFVGGNLELTSIKTGCVPSKLLVIEGGHIKKFFFRRSRILPCYISGNMNKCHFRFLFHGFFQRLKGVKYFELFIRWYLCWVKQGAEFY